MSDKKEDKNSISVPAPGNTSDIKKAGLLRKLKTMKKKYFVLRTESDNGPARLEYYDNEKKFKAGNPAKRSIHIKTCFNINRKIDAKHKLAIALYTKDDCFSVVADSESHLEEWLDAMLELQLDGACLTGGAKLKPKFEHVWQVTVGDKSLASSRNMKGLYRLCLTVSSLTLIKVDQADPPEALEFQLMSIRRCGHTNNYFVIELGRSSCTGPGELWLETEDVVIAQNMHEVTLNAMKSCREHEDFGPQSRPRSASNSENSRPTTRQRPIAVVSPQAYGGIRDRCDSLPSRPRTISEGQENNRSYYTTHHGYSDSLKPYGGFSRTISYSPPSIPNPLSPVSATCSTDSAGSSLSIDDFDGCQQTDFAHGRYIHNLPTDGALHTEPPIKEEQLDEYVPMSYGSSNSEAYISMSPMSTSAPSRPSIFLHLNSNHSGHTSSLPPITQDYMEMKSPLDGYINMSPIAAHLETQSNASSLDSSLNDSGVSKDGYIHMAPGHDYSSGPIPQNEGYLDMAPLSSSLPKTFPEATNAISMSSSRKDSSSRLSIDTPISSPSSTNLEDFPLDKVKSLLADTDDASFDSYIRPVRAYSMGSRPQPKKTHLLPQVDGSRIRAYSVGSQNQRKSHNMPVDRDIGSLIKIDPRTGAKSSSAPLLNNRPPRIRSSASRSEMSEDLMEIDYNKAKYSNPSIDDNSFSIEPVGRARTGSYSSSNNNVKRMHQSPADSEMPSDYLSMSPLGDQSKASSAMSKKVEAGDYVSLDPSCTYNIGDKFFTSTTNSSAERTNIYSKSQESKSHSYIVPSLSRVNSCTEGEVECAENSLNGVPNANNKEPAKSDYMCMNFQSNKNALPSKSHSQSPAMNPKEKDVQKDQEPKASSPVSKTASFTHGANFVPKTPPPSPSYGAHLTNHASSPFVDNVVRRLSQTGDSNSRPNSVGGEVQLNYASLDLPPASEDDSKSASLKLKKSASDEDSKEPPLTYAQIDFSPVRQKAFQEPESSLSHL